MSQPGYPVSRFMTANPVSVTSSCRLSEAHALMRVMRFRHLPVVDQGELVGVLSDRDIHLQNSMSGGSEDDLTVGDAMTPGPLSFRASYPVRDVADRMAQLRCGSAMVVSDDGKLVGIFTTVDACRALVLLCDERTSDLAKAA